jgi:DNA primase
VYFNSVVVFVIVDVDASLAASFIINAVESRPLNILRWIEGLKSEAVFITRQELKEDLGAVQLITSFFLKSRKSESNRVR